MPHCSKEVTRIGNHLRQTHKFKDNNKIKNYVSKAQRVHVKEESSSRDYESSDSDAHTEKMTYIPLIVCKHQKFYRLDIDFL